MNPSELLHMVKNLPDNLFDTLDRRTQPASGDLCLPQRISLIESMTFSASRLMVLAAPLVSL